MDTEMGLFWKTKIEQLYGELGNKDVLFFTPEEEAKLEEEFKGMKLAERAARSEATRRMYGWPDKLKQIEEGGANTKKGLFSYILAPDNEKKAPANEEKAMVYNF